MKTTGNYRPFGYLKSDSLTGKLLGARVSKSETVTNKARQFSINVALISPPNVVLHESKKDGAKNASFTTTTFFAVLIEPPRGYGDVLDSAGTTRKAVIAPESGGIKFDDANMSVSIPIVTKADNVYSNVTLSVGKPFVCVANKAIPNLQSQCLYKLQISRVIWSDFRKGGEFCVDSFSEYDGFDCGRHMLELPKPWPARILYAIYAGCQSNPAPLPLVNAHPEAQYSNRLDQDTQRNIAERLWMMPMGSILPGLTDALIRRGMRVIVYGTPAAVVTDKSSAVPHLWPNKEGTQINQTDMFNYNIVMIAKPELPRHLFKLHTTKDLPYIPELYDDALPENMCHCSVTVAHDALRTLSVFSRDQNGEFYGNNSVFAVLLNKTPSAVLTKISVEKSLAPPEEKDKMPEDPNAPKKTETAYKMYSQAVDPLKRDANGKTTEKAKPGTGSVLTHPLVGIVNAGFEIHAVDVAESLQILSETYKDVADLPRTATARSFLPDMGRVQTPSMIFEKNLLTPNCSLNAIRDITDGKEPLAYNVLECRENFSPLLDGEDPRYVYKYKKYTFFAVFQVEKNEGSPVLELLRYVTETEGRDAAKTLFGSLAKQIYKDGCVAAGSKYKHFELDSIFPPVVAPEQPWVGLFAIKTNWLEQNELDVCDPNNENRMVESVLNTLYPPRPQASAEEVADAVKKYKEETTAINQMLAEAKKEQQEAQSKKELPAPGSAGVSPPLNENSKRPLGGDLPEAKKQAVGDGAKDN